MRLHARSLTTGSTFLSDAAGLAALLGVVAFGLVACGAAASAKPADPKPGAAAGGLTAGDHDLKVTVDGQDHDGILYVPKSAAGKTNLPVVMVLHGGGGWASQIRKMAKMDPVADDKGFLVAYPNGTRGMLGYTWNGGDCCGVAMNKGVDDIALFRKLIDTLVKEYGADPKRIYATGISNGAIMSHRLACEMSDQIAAIAPIAGAVMVDCKPKRPVPILFFHGTDDHGLPPAGGTNPKAGSRGPFPPLSKSIETWSRLDSCPSQGKEVYRKGNVICTSYGPCAGDSEIEYCKINGGGHTWPGGEPIFEKKLGMTTKDISASAAMWDFFARHPIP